MSGETSFKGISPLVATVLLIAFVVAIAGIISIWLNAFAREQTQLVGSRSETSITCSYGSINLKDAKFTAASTRLSGTIENIGQIALGNITLSIIYQNASAQTINLCSSTSGAVSCVAENLSLDVSEQSAFNVTIWGDNYESVKIITNCSAVSDTLQRGDIG